MVFKGVSASNDTHPHNKETRHPRPPPLGASRRHSGPGAPCARSCPQKIAARELSLVGAGALETGAGANPAGRQAAGELVAPAGRAATPPPPRFKGQPGGGIFERRSLRSLRLEARDGNDAASLEKSLLCLRRRVPRQGTSFSQASLRLFPQNSVEAIAATSAGQRSAHARCRRGVPPPSAVDSFSCPSTEPGRCPGGSPGAATRLRRGSEARGL